MMTMVRHQRRVPRQQVGWDGKCLLDDDPTTGWVECLVLDISVIGVGIEVFDRLPRDLIGRRIAVDVQPPNSGSMNIHMVGEVRNTGPGRNGGVRVGMEFVDLNDTERSILDALEMMQIAW